MSTYLILVINTLARALIMLIFIRVLMSWVRPNRSNPLVRFIYDVTDPILDLIAKLMPFVRSGMIDFSPIIAIFAIDLLRSVLITFLLM